MSFWKQLLYHRLPLPDQSMHLSVRPVILRYLLFSTGTGISCAAGTSRCLFALKTKHVLIHYCILLLFHNFSINTYCYNLPWYEFSTASKSFFGCHLQSATAWNFHSYNCHALNVVILNNLGQFLAIIHLI